MCHTVNALCHITGSKGSDNGPWWYQIHFGHPTRSRGSYRGPYHSVTAAETAARADAEDRGLEVAFLYD